MIPMSYQTPTMDPGDYVFTPDGSQMVMLRSGIDPRAARVWDVVLDAFVSMGASRTSARADAWRLQHDPVFHHKWAVLLPVWSPSLAYYDPVVTSSFPDDDEPSPVAEDE